MFEVLYLLLDALVGAVERRVRRFRRRRLRKGIPAVPPRG
jgi:hypothetical protein